MKARKPDKLNSQGLLVARTVECLWWLQLWEVPKVWDQGQTKARDLVLLKAGTRIWNLHLTPTVIDKHMSMKMNVNQWKLKWL